MRVLAVLAPVGTRKGPLLVAGNNPRGSWHVDGPQLEDWGVFRIDVTVSGG
jgi:hypothetical protein